MLSAKNRNICVVGDESQSIYSFRGSNYRNILNFEKDYKDCTTILLEQNYRSTSTILDSANDVIKNNKHRKDKNLWTENGVGEKIEYYKAIDEKDEASYVVKNIENLINNNTNKSEIAVLYRTNAQSRVMEEALLKSNIPYKVVGSFYFYNRKEIKDLICYLKLIYNKYDDISLQRIINTINTHNTTIGKPKNFLSILILSFIQVQKLRLRNTLQQRQKQTNRKQ